MDDRFNTIAGWTLAGGICALGLSILTGMYFQAERPEKMGYTVEGVEDDSAGAGPAAPDKPIEFYLASADPAKGAEIFKKCATCHSADKGGPNGQGPDLWGVIGEPIGQGAGGFSFTDALKSKGGAWDWDKLNLWLTSPKSFAPGTKMTFAGLSKGQDRADVIAYLNKQSDAPKPMPAAPAADAAPAGKDAKAADAKGAAPAGKDAKPADGKDAGKDAAAGNTAAPANAAAPAAAAKK
jgi:cytochrome c